MFIIIVFSAVLVIIVFYIYLFYPKQLFPLGMKIDVKTPIYEKYHNDCLHPCIRYVPEGFLGAHWWMVQSPYYDRNCLVENPILYFSKEKDLPLYWEYSALVSDTPISGYNSDPCIFFDNGKLWIFWRECGTPICKKNGVSKATVGCYTTDGVSFSDVNIYLVHAGEDDDKEQCPILIKKDNFYCFYTVHYQYQPQRKFNKLIIWKGSSLEDPDFQLDNKCTIPTVLTCDKWKQKRIGKRLIFIPKHQKHDLWHFDLIEYENVLLIISVAEWGDSVMLGVSHDYLNFKMKLIPLINNHYYDSVNGYRPYFYKPTGYIKDHKLHLFYTATSPKDPKCNEMWYSVLNMDKII